MTQPETVSVTQCSHYREQTLHTGDGTEVAWCPDCGRNRLSGRHRIAAEQAHPDGDAVERVALALAKYEGEDWDAADFTKTGSGEEPDEMRGRLRGSARAALSAMPSGLLAEAERARIVEWLRGNGFDGSTAAGIADAIERGDHLPQKGE